MNEESKLLSYAELASIFADIHLNANPSQIHGLLCGYLCGPSRDLETLWDAIFGKQERVPSLLDRLQEWLEIIYQQLNEFSFDVTLVLPDDDEDINIRAEALGSWCQGFLQGLEKQSIPIKNRPESETTEALNDIIEISKISFGEIPTNDEDESAYFELVEYVRLSVVMIFQDLKADPLPIDESSTSLH